MGGGMIGAAPQGGDGSGQISDESGDSCDGEDGAAWGSGSDEHGGWASSFFGFSVFVSFYSLFHF